MGDFVSLLNSVFYLKSQQLTVWVELLDWDTTRFPPIRDFLLIHFPDLSPAERDAVFLSSGTDAFLMASSGSGSSSKSVLGYNHPHTQADVIVATSIDTIASVMHICNQSPHKTTPVYIVNDFPVLSSYATGHEHEKYVSFLRKFGALNSSVTVLSRSQWVIDTASQENSNLVIQKTSPSIDHRVFYISKADLRRKANKVLSLPGTVFRIMVRFRGSKAIDQTIMHSLILLLQQTKMIRFRILDVPSATYIKELCGMFKDSAIAISSKTATALAAANFEYISFNYTRSQQFMANYYRETDLFVDASEMTGWAMQRSVLEAQACGCVMVLPAGSMAQSISDNSIDECLLVFETTRANKLQRLVFTFLQNDNRRSLVVSSMIDKSAEYSPEEDGISFLDKVSALKSSKGGLNSAYLLSKESFLFFLLIALLGFLVLGAVYTTYIRPNNKIKLYNRVSNNNGEKE
jgi:glycosyltransferase involved in cell wall biosynthesis